MMSKKAAAISGLRAVGTFFAKRDIGRLEDQVRAIKAELARRDAQEPLF